MKCSLLAALITRISLPFAVWTTAASAFAIAVLAVAAGFGSSSPALAVALGLGGYATLVALVAVLGWRKPRFGAGAMAAVSLLHAAVTASMAPTTPWLAVPAALLLVAFLAAVSARARTRG